MPPRRSATTRCSARRAAPSSPRPSPTAPARNACRGSSAASRQATCPSATRSSRGSSDEASAMRSILRPAALIETWFDTLRPEQHDPARILRPLVQAASPELVPSVKWGNLRFTLEGTHAVAIVMHKDHANLQIFNGALLAERFPELEGTGRGMRHVRFRYRYPVD